MVNIPAASHSPEKGPEKSVEEPTKEAFDADVLRHEANRLEKNADALRLRIEKKRGEMKNVDQSQELVNAYDEALQKIVELQESIKVVQDEIGRGLASPKMEAELLRAKEGLQKIEQAPIEFQFEPEVVDLKLPRKKAEGITSYSISPEGIVNFATKEDERKFTLHDLGYTDTFLLVKDAKGNQNVVMKSATDGEYYYETPDGKTKRQIVLSGYQVKPLSAAEAARTFSGSKQFVESMQSIRSFAETAAVQAKEAAPEAPEIENIGMSGLEATIGPKKTVDVEVIEPPKLGELTKEVEDASLKKELKDGISTVAKGLLRAYETLKPYLTVSVTDEALIKATREFEGDYINEMKVLAKIEKKIQKYPELAGVKIPVDYEGKKFDIRADNIMTDVAAAVLGEERLKNIADVKKRLEKKGPSAPEVASNR